MSTTTIVNSKVRADYRTDNVVVQNYIDPTKAHLFAAQTASPTGLALVNLGMVWVKATTPTTLWYTDSAGTSFSVAGSGATLVGFTGASNTGLGVNAGTAITSGTGDTVVGVGAGAAITTGSNITAVGLNALHANTTGSGNTAIGENTLSANVTGTNNTAIGLNALNQVTGNNNTVVGANSGQNITSGGGGANNTIVGEAAGNTLTLGSNNIYIGVGADALSGATELNTTRIGTTTTAATFVNGTLVTNQTNAPPAGALITAPAVVGGVFIANAAPTLCTGTQLDSTLTQIVSTPLYSLQCLVLNNTAGSLTITGASGTVLQDTSAAIPAHGSRYLLFIRTGANAYNVY